MARMPGSATTRRSGSGISSCRLASRLAGSARTASAAASVRARQTFGAVRGRRVLRDVGLRHAVVPVQAVSTAGREADQHRGLRDAVREQRGAGQGVRAAAGAADNGEFVQAVGVGDGQDVGGGVGDRGGLPGGRICRSQAGRRRSAGRPGGAGRRPAGAVPDGCPASRAAGRRASRPGRRTPGWTTACRRAPSPGNSNRFLPFSHFLSRMGESIIDMVPMMRNGRKSRNRTAQVRLLQTLPLDQAVQPTTRRANSPYSRAT